MKVMAAVMAVVAGERINVAEVCREAQISRKTFYKWAARCRAEGVDGLQERTRRPRRVPHQTPVAVEDAVVRLRKELADAGLDHGATTIQWHLGQRRRGGPKPPSVATIHRILVRRGLVSPEPKKRPKASWRRFEAPAPNEWWQIDAMDWVIATGVVKVFNVIDDHSRLVTASRAVLDATSEEAWTTFCHASRRWGLPAGVLSDNGLCFSGKLRGFEVLFETRLRAAGVRPFTGRPYHPQTTGKVERFQQTLKRWLRRQSLAADVVELQAQLDKFCQIYNHERPHQGIGRVTPISRWKSTTARQPSSEPIERPAWLAPPWPVTISKIGMVRVDGVCVGVGVEWAGHHATVMIDPNNYATIFVGDQLVRHLKIDRTRYYQPTGRQRGGPRRTRHLTS